MTMLEHLKTSRHIQELLALISFLALMAVGILWIIFNLTELNAKSMALATAQSTLSGIETRRAAVSVALSPQMPEPAGSPFLEGESQTVAGAHLQSRIIGLVTANGGFVTSSQSELQSLKPEDTSLRLSVSFEIAYPNIQPILYQIEAGMPYLFVEKLDLDAPEGAGPMKATLAVSGMWQRQQP